MVKFLKGVAASAIGTIVGLLVFVVLLGIGAGSLVMVLLATTSRETEPSLDPNSLLVIDLSTPVRDAVPPSGASVVLEETLSGSSNEAISIYQALRAIEQAAEDERIAGIFLYGNTFNGLATLGELRQALVAFKDSGKPIFAYEVGWSERDYYLTSVADTVSLDTTGLLEFNGFRAETQFLAGALEKYGVGVQVLRAGRYKSAIEPFVRTSSSPEEQEQTEALLADLWQVFLTTVDDSRTPSQGQLQQLADAGGILLPEDAKAAGLVDQVAYYEDVLADLQSLTGEDASVGEDLPSVDLPSYSTLINSEAANEADDVVAIVYAEGEITLGEGGTGFIGSDSLSRTLRDLRLDDAVKAVVLRINSPGGGASASEVIADAVRRLQAEKPVVVSMGNIAASGGYMMAAEGSRIYASANTITGSIGVFGLLLNFQAIANRNGVTWDVVKTARFADIDTVARPQSPEELALQQTVVDELYDRFITLVAEGRNLSEAQIESVAQGRVWSGQAAQTQGLVDELGGLMDAIAAAAEQAELTAWSIEEYPQPLSLEAQIIESLFGGISSRLQATSPLPTSPLLAEWEALQSGLTHLETLNDPRGAYTRLPFTTEIE
ncbi:MAG: signal peptide peptidase SppA [Leptolyngbya sp. RL_3_1]|nr:signal peptide peptidase SppA [Leptolyngbya sp. RL_3_1]